MYSIRIASPEDSWSLAELAERTFRETFTAMNTAENLNLHCRASYGEAMQMCEIVNPDLLTLVCEEDGKLIGFSQLRWGKAPSCVVAERSGELQRLYVLNAWHGKGIAQDLMSACIVEMEKRHVDAIWQGVWEQNPRAITFYKKFGFVEVGDHVFPLGADPQRDIVMARRVSSQ